MLPYVLDIGSHPSASDGIRPWLLVFDLDGTLIDSSRDLCTSVNAALSQLGRPSLSQAVISGFIGDGAATLIRRALAATAQAARNPSLVPESDATFPIAYDSFINFYRRHMLDTTSTYSGVAESLAEIRHRRPDLLMAVLTNKPVNPSRAICSALGLEPFFFANYGGDSFTTKKPAPEGLLAIMHEGRLLSTASKRSSADLTASGVVMIGDSPADVLTARAVGALSLGCLYGLAPEELKRAKPGRLVNAPSEWITALGLV